MEKANKTKKEHLQGLEATYQHLSQLEQAEETLRESEEEHERLFDILPIGITILNLKGVIIYCNSAVYDKSGYTEGEFTGKHFSKISSIRIKDIPKYIRLLNSIVRGKTPKPFEASYHRKDGTTGWTELNISLLKVGGKRHILVMQHDITERKQTERALRESEEKLRLMFESVTDGIAVTDLKGVIIECNYRAVNMYGASSREEILGKSCLEFIAHRDRERAAADMQKTIAANVSEGIEYGILKADGSEFNGEVRPSVIKDASGNPFGLIAIIRDITERKQAEDTLANEATRRRILVEQSRDGIVILDQNGNVYEANQRFADMLGYSLEEVSQLHVFDWEFLYPREQVIEMIKTVDEKGDHFETQHRRKDGTIFNVEISTNGAMFAGHKLIFCVCRDITERKRAEEAIRESEKRFSDITKNALEWIWEIDANGKYTYSSPVVEKILGYEPEEILNKHFYELFLPEQREELKKATFAAFTQKQPFHEFINPNVHKNGQTIWLSTSGIPIIDKEGNLLGYRGADTDITERKKAEEGLKQAMTNLEQSSAQLAATNKELETFNYSVSHDLRSPLRSIDGFSQALLEDYRDKLDEQGQDYLNRLRSASQKMGELIDGMLKLSRLTRSEMHQEKVDLSALAEEITTRLQETQPERRAKFVIHSGLTTKGDPQMMRVLLENLLVNAWKFTSKTPQALIEFGSTDKSNKKTFFVKDNGAGFDMTYVDKLFGAFQRLHDTAEFPGTGIGLATVQRIINRHGGNIRAEGTMGKGATFYFTLE